MLSATPDRAFATWRSVLFVAWRKETSVEAVEEVGRHARELGRAFPDGILLLINVEDSAPPPSSKARGAMASMLKAATDVRAAAIVHQGQGFGASMVRMVVQSLNMIAKYPYPSRVFGTNRAGAGWLVEQVDAAGIPELFSKEELIAAIEEIKSAYAVH
ncbi:MAG: hypothetical protein AAF799_29535 [Myxococcota bacterium]